MNLKTQFICDYKTDLSFKKVEINYIPLEKTIKDRMRNIKRIIAK